MTATHEPANHHALSSISSSPETPNYALLERVSRRALRRHALNERERLVAEIVLDFSYAIARPAALIPRQEIFVTLTGISKGNVSACLMALESARILHILRAEALYTFLPDSSTWKVKSRLASDAHVAEADRAEAWLVETAWVTPEQLHLLPPLPDLTLLLAADAREELINNHRGIPATRPGDQPDATSLGLPAVPQGDELTARIAESLQRPVPSPSPTASPPLVSDSGTGATESVQRCSRSSGNSPLNALNVSYRLPLNANIKCAVPESGTRGAEGELLAEIRDVCGSDAMRQYGGWWRLQARNHPADIREALGDLKLRRLDPHHKRIRNPGAWLRDRYNRILNP